MVQDEPVRTLGSYDAVIVGAGVAGWSAARRAQQLGLSVLVLERHTSGPGWGNGRLSGGWFHAAYLSPRRSPDDLYATLMRKTQGHGRPELARAWADNVARALQFLVDEGGTFAPLGPEEHMQNVLHPPRPAGLGRDWAGRGPDQLLSAMWRSFVAAGGDFRPGRRARRLLTSGTAVIGVVAEADGGEEAYLGRAVILCDGGFQANPDLVGRHITSAYKLRGATTDVGDALLMGREAGAKAVNLEWFYGHVLSRDSLRNDALWPALGLHALLGSSICVDGSGSRFADEGRGDEILADRIAKCATPGSCWLVFDDLAWRTAGAAGPFPLNPQLSQAGGTVLTAGSPAELADSAGLPAAALAGTIRLFNEQLQAASPWNVPRTMPARPIEVLPLHAIPAIAGITFAMGGLLVNSRAQVLGDEDTVIAGLYAAGGSMGGLQGGPGFGYSGGWSEASVFGLIAAESVAREPGAGGAARGRPIDGSLSAALPSGALDRPDGRELKGLGDINTTTGGSNAPAVVARGRAASGPQPGDAVTGDPRPPAADGSAVRSARPGAGADSEADIVLVERLRHHDADLAVVTLNRPAHRNPLDWAVVRRLHAVIEALSADGGPDAVIITGAGTAFSSGGDLRGYTRLYREPDNFRQFMADLEQMCQLIEDCRPLVLAMVNGTCVAGGLELCLACDLVTIADTASVGDGHLRSGQLPGGGGSQRLVRAIGVSRARQWLLTGQLYPAADIVSAGLAILSAPPDELREKTLDLAARITRFTPLGIQLMKRLIVTAQDSPLREGLTAEQRLVLEYATTSHDATEGLEAFLERRPPRYLGR
jgi:enoyl-CoA hydratase/carnithine racemase/succinate dehydrogenase/fumarate reductase flavoprotein subunit